MKNKIIYSLSTLVFIFLAGIGSAQNMVPKKCYLHLLGSINKEYPIEINLVKINDTIYGDYSFIQRGKIILDKSRDGASIQFAGRMNSSDAFTLTEMNALHINSLKGKFISNQSISGYFEDSKGKKLPFDATEKYPDGSVSLNVYYLKASILLVKKPGAPNARIQLGLLLPGESANPLISDSLISLMLEKFTGKQVRITQPEKLLDGMKEIYFETYSATNEGIFKESMASSFNWQSLKFLHILMNSSHILSFYIDHYAFTGGAHGIQTRQFTVVNLWSGKEVGLKDIFKEDTKAQLSKIITDKIHEMNSIPTTQRLKDVGFFTDSVFPSDNFYVTRKGIGFYYNQYDVAPYASGAIDVFIPFEDLKDVMRMGGLIEELIKD
jgi:hypothetical protein